MTTHSSLTLRSTVSSSPWSDAAHRALPDGDPWRRSSSRWRHPCKPSESRFLLLRPYKLSLNC